MVRVAARRRRPMGNRRMVIVGTLATLFLVSVVVYLYQSYPPQEALLSSWEMDKPVVTDPMVPFLPNTKKSIEEEPTTTTTTRTSSKVRTADTKQTTDEGGALQAFDLSVNHLQRLPANNNDNIMEAETFLPIVSPSRPIVLRFRLRPVRTTPSADAIKDISAYQIVATTTTTSEEQLPPDTILWDSGKVRVESAPRSVLFFGPDHNQKLPVGTIVHWKVLIWDAQNNGPVASNVSKFGLGPHTWTAKWISHPHDNDAATFDKGVLTHGNVSPSQCQHWKARRPLPVARAYLDVSSSQESRVVVSALLVVSGLGSFAVSMNGVPLSTSSVLDPPLTDYTQRISYRGYDVTSFFTKDNNNNKHVVGIVLGSGWWDARPLKHRIVKFNILPRGPLTTIAQLHLVYSDGTTSIEIPSGDNKNNNNSSWQMGKGFVRDSDLFTGDTIDLGRLSKMKDWDTASGWSEIDNNDSGPSKDGIVWTEPALYKSDTTTENWRRALEGRAGAADAADVDFAIAPLGQLVPMEAPPVLPMEKIVPESVTSLGDGRWVYDFGKGFSGLVRFEEGLPTPMVPVNGYPRGHDIDAKEGESFISVIYGDSLAMETGDVNVVIVAGFGYHMNSPEDALNAAGPCFPRDHGSNLLQRDVFIIPKDETYTEAVQSLFTSHSFRFAEVCCSETAPTGVVGVKYRTAFQEWGRFDSSNVRLNGAHELTRNALNSNMLGTQTDCPHREKLQYGGDLNADSPAAMHFFDLGAFYSKVIHDWIDTQWENGAYTETSIWQDLNEQQGIGHGAGETVWAAAPPVLTVRHAQHYGDEALIAETLPHHIKWIEFLKKYWEAGMEKNFGKFGADLKEYHGSHGGLGDWLSLHSRDTWLTHHAFHMASARAIAYLANKLTTGDDMSATIQGALEYADTVREKITSLYMQDSEKFGLPQGMGGYGWSPGSDLALFARIVPGEKRCAVVKEWIRYQGQGDRKIWPGDEEQRFYRRLNPQALDEMIQRDQVRKDGKNKEGEQKYMTMYTNRRHTSEGILAIRYALKALSDTGFHNIALSKADGEGCPSFEYMLSHNATTLWETWWRSEDVYSRNHPMLGAVAEWLASSVAGVSLAPKTYGGNELLFWPRIPTSAKVVQFASATQGTKRGDASIAWKFTNIPLDGDLVDDSASVGVHIRVVVPPASSAILRLPIEALQGKCSMKHAERIPDLEAAKAKAIDECNARRKRGLGFGYNWEYLRDKQEWYKIQRGKAIGTPCDSYLFAFDEHQLAWSEAETVFPDNKRTSDFDLELPLEPGLYDIEMQNWQLSPEIEDVPGYSKYDGHIVRYCSQPDTFSWELDDATHMI